MKPRNALFTAMAFVTAFAGLVMFGQEKKYLAPDGVNTITDHGNGIISSTLIHVTALRAYSHEDYVRDNGRWPLTRGEAEEIVRALIDSANAHRTALNFYTTAEKALWETATEAERERLTQNVRECEESSRRAQALLEKWKERGAKLKD